MVIWGSIHTWTQNIVPFHNSLKMENADQSDEK